MSSGGKFGNLKPNNAAKQRRGAVKFFDSAEWAMKGQTGCAQCNIPDSPNVTQDTISQNEGKDQNEGISPLAGGDSLLTGGDSFLTGGDSALCGE